MSVDTKRSDKRAANQQVSGRRADFPLAVFGKSRLRLLVRASMKTPGLLSNAVVFGDSPCRSPGVPSATAF